MAVSMTKRVDPVTYAEDTAETLVGRLVLVRPYFHVPDGRSSLRRARSRFCFEAFVTQPFAGTSDAVMVRFDWATDSAPWKREGMFKTDELHVPRSCLCPGCKGDGIDNLDGA